jgi:hypothetical protein
MVLILPSIGLTTMRAFVEDVVKVSRKLGYLKAPKLEIFGFRVFTQISPVWVWNRPKNLKF